MVSWDEDGLDGELGFFGMFFERAGNFLAGRGYWTDSALEAMAFEEEDEEEVEGVEYGLDEADYLDFEDEDDYEGW